jgi:hypothetical protein
MAGKLEWDQAIEICEALFEKYGIAEEDKDRFVAAMESMCLHQLHMKTGPFYQAHEEYLAEKALEDVQEDAMIAEELAKLEQLRTEIDADVQKARAARQNTIAVAKQRIRWHHKLQEIDELRDGLGKPVDAGIRETVAILQLLGLNTSASCEGHLDWGLPVPWVDVHVPETKALREQRMPLEVRLDALEEGTLEFEQVLQERNAVWHLEEQWEAQAYVPLFHYLEAFYTDHFALYDHRIILDGRGRVTIQGGVLQAGRDAETRARKLTVYQVEMRMFTDFLKEQFFALKF